MSYSRDGGGAAVRLTATVKWFNRTKGFGFVTATDGSGDVFLPAAVLAQAGQDEAADGTTVVCEVIEGPRGRSVAGILSIDRTTAALHPPRGSRVDRDPAGPTEELDGTVKWFDEAKGFGFMSASDGGKDVFVHVSVLRRSGLGVLQTGQLVKMQVKQSEQGREATSVELI